MVFNTFTLQMNICQAYIFVIWILYIPSVDADCFTEDPENVVDVCSSSSRTNRLVHLYVDNQRVLPNVEGECSCDVTISTNWRTIIILYSSSLSSSCGIEFQVLTYLYDCKSLISPIKEPFNRTTFRKTANIDGPACLSISLDHNFPNTNATVTVTCHAVSTGTSATSYSFSVSSGKPTIPPSSSIMMTPTEKRLPTNSAQTERISTSSKETSMLTRISTRKVPSQTGNYDSSDGDKLGIIIGAVGGGAVVLIFTIILAVCCYRTRRHKAKTTNDYIYSASDKTVSDNMVKQHPVPLNSIDAIYNTINDDALQQAKATPITDLYANLQLDDDGGTDKSAKFEKYQQDKIRPDSVKYDFLLQKDYAGACNTDHFYDGLNIQNKT